MRRNPDDSTAGAIAPAGSRRIAVPVFFVSAAAIGYEVLLMRVLSIVQWHHFAWMIISVALLGYGASGTFIALAGRSLTRRFPLAFSAAALLFATAMVACFALAQRVPFNALEIVWGGEQFVHLGVLYLVLFVPFFFAATCIGLALTCASEEVARIYFFDLSGAGAGALATVAALFILLPSQALLALVALALLAAACAPLAPPFASRVRAACAAVAAAALLLPAGILELRMSPYKDLSQALEVMDAHVVAERSSPLGLLTVVASPAVPFRHAPGLAFTARAEPREQLAMFSDGGAPAMLTRHEGAFAGLEYMDDMPQALPYRLLERPRVLILGAGGGSDVLFALYHDARAIDAVELDRRAVELVADTFADFTGHIYEHPRVAVHVAEARGFVAAASTEYDLIQLSLLDSFAAAGSGTQALSESYLYTVEALQLYLSRLAPGGMLAITRWLRMPPRDSLKLVATAIEALERDGIADPGNRLAVIRSWNTSTVLVANGAIDERTIARLREFARARSFDVAWYPGMPRTEANRYNLLPEPWLYDGTAALLGPQREDFLARYKFDLRPATDDRPYFFNFFKWSSFAEMAALRDQGGAGLIEWGYPVVLATFVQAAVLGALLILVPLALRRRGARGGAAPGGYFFLIGLAFMFVEIAFIQKFILFLSHPLYAIAVVLAGFLVFAGLGSAWTARLRRPHTIVPATAAISALAVAYLFLLPPLFARAAALGDPAKIGLSLALIAPLAFFMGMPFPQGVASLARRRPGFIPWAWGLNGYASVTSASLAALLAVAAGFSVVLLLALGLYWAAALSLNAWSAGGPEKKNPQRA